MDAAKQGDRLYPSALRLLVVLSTISCVMFMAALCVAIGPAIDWSKNYEETNCTVNSVQTSGEVECSIPVSERVNAQDNGLAVVPCVQVNVTYTNSSGVTRNSPVAMPRRGVLLAEYSSGSQQRVYHSSDYLGEPIPGPDGSVDTRRRSILTRALFATRTCTFLDCRRDREQVETINERIAERYPAGMNLPCWVYKPGQMQVDIAALVVLKQVQTDSVVLGWALTTLLSIFLTFPVCLFLCCREWLCRCPEPMRSFQYF